MAKRRRKRAQPAQEHKAVQKAAGRSLRPALWGALGLVLVGGTWGVYRKLSSRPELVASPSSPNVLLISIDMLRPDHLRCYGYQRETSPRLDQVAAEGVLFENHISSTSWTLPAHAAMFTALADSVHGCTDTDKKLSDKLVTLAERFAAGGYRTVGFFSGPYLHPAFGLGQGFEHYENCTSFANIIDGSPVERWAMDSGVEQRSHRDITNHIVYPAVKTWLDQNGSSRFFMFIHMWDVHFDFIPPAPYKTMFDPDYAGTITGIFLHPRVNPEMPKRDLEHLLALYDGEIAWTDYYLGRILDDLESSGLLDETVVAITSDHGTEFFEHGGKSHRRTLFDEAIRIPLIIRYPARLPADLRVAEQTRIIDIGPTLLELAGLPPMHSVMGHSLVPLMLGQPPDFDNIAVAELFSLGRRMRTIRTLEWKFTELMMANNARFYVDLVEDPGERHLLRDLAEGRGRQLLERYQTIVEALDAWRAQASAGAERSTIPDDVLRQLQSLGYVGEEEP